MKNERGEMKPGPRRESYPLCYVVMNSRTRNFSLDVTISDTGTSFTNWKDSEVWDHYYG